MSLFTFLLLWQPYQVILIQNCICTNAICMCMLLQTFAFLALFNSEIWMLKMVTNILKHPVLQCETVRVLNNYLFIMFIVSVTFYYIFLEVWFGFTWHTILKTGLNISQFYLDINCDIFCRKCDWRRQVIHDIVQITTGG